MNLDKLRQTISKASEEPKTALLRDADNLWTSIPQPSMQSADLKISGNNSALNKTLVKNVQSSQILCDTPLRDPLPITPN